MTTPSYDDIRQQVERRYRRRSFLLYHFGFAAVCLTVVWLTTTRMGSPGVAMLLTLLWAGLFILHGVKVLMDEAKDRAIESTWRRYHGDFAYADEKPKRDTLHLTDDGELLDIVEDEENQKRVFRG